MHAPVLVLIAAPSFACVARAEGGRPSISQPQVTEAFLRQLDVFHRALPANDRFDEAPRSGC